MVFGVRNAPKMIQRLQKGDPEDAKAGPRAPGSKDGPGTLGGITSFLAILELNYTPVYLPRTTIKSIKISVIL